MWSKVSWVSFTVVLTKLILGFLKFRKLKSNDFFLFSYHETLMGVITSNAAPANHSRKFSNLSCIFLPMVLIKLRWTGNGQISISWVLLTQSNRAKTWKPGETAEQYETIYWYSFKQQPLFTEHSTRLLVSSVLCVNSKPINLNKRLDSHWWKSISSPVSSPSSCGESGRIPKWHFCFIGEFT